MALPSVIRILRTEGVGALFLGFPAKVARRFSPSFLPFCVHTKQVLRLGPGGGIMMGGFELAKSIMQ
jgi:hypothetical protein